MKGKFVFLVIVIFILAACVPPTPKEKVAPSVEPQKEVSSLYAEEPKKLTPVECGQCHSPIYNLIRKEGGRHQIYCTDCHEQFHMYNPIKQNWAEIMPKCENCHGLYHGETLAKCMECHVEPHAPKKIPMSTMLENNCLTCHGKIGDEMKQYPSLHSEQSCSLCHEKHGYIPNCMDCHEPHLATLTTNEQCLECHPVHSPVRPLKYAEETPNEICGVCHGEIMETLDASLSKHHDVACVECHNVHKYIPKCTECHPQSHSEALLKQFPDCLKCHIDPHNLPAEATIR
ncbi:MAG: cytochrome C [Candidatus Desulfofervidus auxilii]|nr:cytochrome C [Candidatus Desulfofervidus auxilii]